MGRLIESASAKVNLTLQIRGKRPDGYHELESLVMFADYGDTISFEEADSFSFAIDGPFAATLSGSDNLVEKAAAAFAEVTGKAVTGTFRLTKRLPVTAGIGGGSADAAAVFRLLQRHYGIPTSLSGLNCAARNIGADVPVCLMSKAAIMTGIGERLYSLPEIEPIPAVLVNPMEPLPTAPVFRALESAPLPDDFTEPERPHLASREAIIAYASAGSNDLEAPALNLLPAIGEVLAILEELPGAVLRRLSGSGPTCFAIFRTMGEAESAALAITGMRPGWWVQATKLS